ncbi:hypothetical protein I4U23_015178 [Adineta vaga]|nr:hypothetical protein I4U23_015178 [Adineta vaga]
MSHRRMRRDKFVCIWLDKQSNRSDDYTYIHNTLQTILDSFRTYRNANQCVDYIFNLKNMKGILITIDTFAEEIIPVIHNCEQINSIYILTSKKTTYQAWIKDYSKIHGIFHDRKQLADEIKRDITQSQTDTLSISLISSTDVSSHDINRQDPSFMYSQLLKEIILNDHKEEKEDETRQDMLQYCRTIYANNPDTLTILDEFEQNFIPELSIYWYTRECFLYRILNKALYTPEPHVLYKLRYFLRHLHQQIVSQATLQRTNLLPMTVYRGQSISLDQIEKLQRNVGGFLSFNNFLSTSRQRDVAMNFLLGFEISVLFEMKINPSIDKFPFANIEHLSYQQGNETEEEFLFSTGTVFRILQIDKTDDLFYSVQLTLSVDTDEQLAEYTKQTREEIRSPHSFLSLLKLMHQLSQYDNIEDFAKMFHNDQTLVTDIILSGGIHHVFGSIYNERDQPKKALKHLQESLSQYLTIMPADHPKLSPTYNNIGSAHATQSDYETALTFYQLALDCQSNSSNPDVSSIVAYTNNIASIYFQQKQYTKALESHKHALKLQLEHFGDNNSSLTNTYNIISVIYYKLNDPEQAERYREKATALQENTTRSDPSSSAACLLTTGTVCFSQGQYQDALNNFNQALKIQQQYLLPNNPAFLTTYNCIGNAYYKQNRFDEALRYHKRALELEEHCLSHDHSSIASRYFNLSKDYVGLSQWSDALSNALHARKLMQKSTNNDSSDVLSILQHLAYIYKQQQNYQEALNYYQRAVELQKKDFPSDQSALGSLYDRIASVYAKQNQVEEALVYYKKVLTIEKRSLPDDHPSIAASYMNISKAYADLLCWSDALEYGLKGVEQMKKSSETDATVLAPLIQYISHIYLQQKEYQQVITYSHEALKLYTTYLSVDDSSLISIYHRISQSYYKLKEYHRAIPFYQKVLRIELKTLPNDAKTIGNTYLNLSTTYMNLEQFDEALTTGDQALNQFSKTLPYNHSEVVQLRTYLNAIKIQQMLQAEQHHRKTK